MTALLPKLPDVPAGVLGRIRADYERLAVAGWPDAPDRFVQDRYGIDLTTTYAGNAIRQPFGKASGQLSMTAGQVADDVAAGLGFVVLKTVIAQDARGTQTMDAWAIREARMVVERITGQSGETGWTVTWKGRGWWQTFEEYLQLVRDARSLAAPENVLIVPSCKYHLPSSREAEWKVEEYDYTTNRLLEAWENVPSGSTVPMPIEKDFSPTLAGSDRADAREKILEWLRMTPRLIREAARRDRVRVGLKLFNALFDDGFQCEMLSAIHDATGDERPDFSVYGNRLFDPGRTFDGQRGVAYGGPDLSDRNLRVLDRFLAERPDAAPLPWSATGNIVSGRIAMEYALRGANSFQLHTYFQLPSTEYAMAVGTKVQKALHELLLHPDKGLLVWMCHAAGRLGLSTQPLRFSEIVQRGRELARQPV